REILTNLTDIMFAGYDDNYPPSPDMFYHCLGIPRHRRLRGYRLGNNTQETITPLLTQYAPSSLPVESIELRCSKLFHEDFNAVLAACKPLKECIYEIGCAWAWVDTQTPQIRSALGPHEKSLQRLCLDHENEKYYPFQVS